MKTEFTPGPFIELAERCEAATAEQQHEMLTAAYEALIQLPGPFASYERQCLFLRYLGAGAFTDAALTLVPEGCKSSFVQMPDGWVAAYIDNHVGIVASCDRVATLALAICAAAWRARAAA